MMETNGNPGNMVVSVSSCSATELRVTNEHKGDRNRNRKRDHPHRAFRSLEAIVEDLNQAMKAMNRRIVFTVSGKGSKRVVRMIDADSNSVIREVPGEEMQRAARIANLLGVGIDQNG
jgi:uncharacterized FlaG/YvyC family protein